MDYGAASMADLNSTVTQSADSEVRSLTGERRCGAGLLN